MAYRVRMESLLHLRLIIALAILAAVPGFAAGQSGQTPASQPAAVPQDQPAERRIVPTFFHDEVHMWTGPFHARNYDSRTMKYGLPFLLISGAMIATDRHTANWLPNTSGQVIWSGRVSQVGAPYTLAGFSAGTYLIGRAVGNPHARETGFLSMEALAHSGLIVFVLKEITQRQRPLDITHRGGFWEGGSSFPSGHAMSSFAVATVFAYEYHDHIAVPIAAYSLASLVALSRVGAREHWASDIFVGSAMGFLIGRYVYKQHHDPELPGLPVRRSSLLHPDVGFGDRGPGLYWHF